MLDAIPAELEALPKAQDRACDRLDPDLRTARRGLLTGVHARIEYRLSTVEIVVEICSTRDRARDLGGVSSGAAVPRVRGIEAYRAAR